MGCGLGFFALQKLQIKNVYTINKFFNENVVREIINEFGYADLITSQNVLAHIEDLEATFINIYDLLKQDGFFCFEIGYFGKVLENGLFIQYIMSI